MASSTTLWPLEPHTKGKHEVLRAYLNAWLPILASFNDRILFIDGFAGPGRYAGGEEGSPLIAIRALREHAAKSSIKEVVFIFIESDPKRAEHLKNELASLEGKGELPANCNAGVEVGKFDTSLKKVLDTLEQQKKRLAPAFVMIDPFGVSDTPMDLISRLLQNSKLELYISLMYENINRFKKSDEFEPHLDDLFGTPDWRQGITIADKDERKSFFFDLYERQLRAAGAQHVVRFELFQENRLKYAIFFATTHLLGADRMKQAIWRIAPQGDFTFKGVRSAQLSLGMSDPDYAPLKEAIRTHLKSHGTAWVTVEEVERFVVAETDYHSTQYKKNALVPLEKEGLIEADPTSRKRPRTFPDGTRLRAKQ